MALHTSNPLTKTQMNLVPFSNWTSGFPYNTGDFVLHSTGIWKATRNNIADTPTSTSTSWSLQLGGGGGAPGGSNTNVQFNSSATFAGDNTTPFNYLSSGSLVIGPHGTVSGPSIGTDFQLQLGFDSVGGFPGGNIATWSANDATGGEWDFFASAGTVAAPTAGPGQFSYLGNVNFYGYHSTGGYQYGTQYFSYVQTTSQNSDGSIPATFGIIVTGDSVEDSGWRFESLTGHKPSLRFLAAASATDQRLTGIGGVWKFRNGADSAYTAIDAGAGTFNSTSFILPNLPSSNPQILGALWMSSTARTLVVSSGP